ncbi:hypothetical protein V8E53_012497 [Lactarius tabidus]
MAEAAYPWPEYIHQSFNSAKMQDVNGRDETVYYGPFTRLLYTGTLFTLDGPYEIKFQFKSESLQVNQRPVLFIEIKPPASLLYDSKREEADEQIRCRIRDLRHELAIPTLHGISAFGRNFPTSNLQPEQILRARPSLLADVVPITRWDCDVLKPEGANRLRDVVKRCCQED